RGAPPPWASIRVVRGRRDNGLPTRLSPTMQPVTPSAAVPSPGLTALMPDGILGLVVASGLAALLASLGTPVAMRAAKSTGFLDRPGGGLKTHGEAIPYLGG